MNKYSITGVDCPNCALKIERNLASKPGVKEVSIDLMSKTLVIDSNTKMTNQQLQSYIDEVEPGTQINDLEDEVVEEESNSIIYRLVISTVLLVIGYLLEGQFLGMLFFLASYLIIGYDIIFKAIKKIGKKDMFDENFLMVIATLGAFAIREYPEAVLVMVLYQLGEYLQDRAVDKSRKSISSLMNIKPEFARVLQDGKEMKVNPQSVHVGDIIICYPGEKIPLDGRVIEGKSELDLMALTGESAYREVTINNEVVSGSINMSGQLKLKVEKTYQNSTVSKILDLVENASSKKAESEKFITKFSRYYTPIVVVFALLLATIPVLLFNQAASDWIYRALVFLVISCPCALVLSVPVTYFAGIGGAAKNGILIKGSNYIEMISKMDTLVLDKTGTITEGKFDVSKVSSFSDESKEHVIFYGAVANRYSNHPIALSIKSHNQQEINDQDLMDAKDYPGKGSSILYKGVQVAVGNLKLMNELNIPIPQALNEVGTVVYVAYNKQCIGSITISDMIKKDSQKAIKQLRSLGVSRIVMLSGDQEKVVKSVADEVGIREYFGELLPQDKVSQFESIKSKNSIVGFVGDGINDAPVLMLSDIGYAMGGIGQDAAIEASDVVIMNDSLMQIAKTKKIANKTQRIVVQNIAFALSVKFLVLGLSVFGFASMWLALFADVGVSLLATMNALRARYTNDK